MTRCFTRMPERWSSYVAQALKQTYREATVMLYAPSQHPHQQNMTELAYRVFCFYGEQASQTGGEDARSTGYAGG
jgi:hypothetical protein